MTVQLNRHVAATPAVTLARRVSDAFIGIAPRSGPMSLVDTKETT